MVENPASWGPVEKAIYEAMRKFDEANKKGVYGPSNVMLIANELRRQGLVKESPQPPDPPYKPSER